MDLRETEILGDRVGDHWYYVSKARLLASLLNGVQVKDVLDVGAGSAVFSRFLLDRGVCARAVCVDTSYAEDKEELHNGRPLFMRREMAGGQFSLILLMDVLEHVDDDRSFLRAAAARMPAGGLVVVTVPAFQFLWSGHDVFLEHRRRYTLAQVEALLRSCGLDVVKGRYFFGLLFPVVAALRLWERGRLAAGHGMPRSGLRTAPGWLNSLLIGIHDLERRTLWTINRLWGLSVVVLARKL